MKEKIGYSDVSENGGGTYPAPATGTRITFAPYKSVKISDISTITLKLNYFKEIGTGIAPSEFSLEQN